MNKLLDVKGLETSFFSEEGVARAVNGISFNLDEGQILGIVGESGCGKSVTARSILRIIDKNGKIVSGNIIYYKNDGKQEIDLTKLDPKGIEIRRIRGKEIAMIFQEPMTSFSPVYTIGNQIIETILLHQQVDKETAREKAINLLDRVGIPRPDLIIDDLPNQLSGGMRQRAMIAMALSCQPKILIADEPTTALDVTIQAQILDLIKDLQDDFNMGVILITHDLGVIAEIADNVLVMYLGKIFESASVNDIFYNSQHPYTTALLNSMPKIHESKKKNKRLATIEGSVPHITNIPEGCSFYPRCSYFQSGKCDVSEPELVEVSSGHKVSCFNISGGKAHG